MEILQGLKVIYRLLAVQWTNLYTPEIISVDILDGNRSRLDSFLQYKFHSNKSQFYQNLFPCNVQISVVLPSRISYYGKFSTYY